LVFVTVGNATQSFTRLLETVDHAAGAGAFGEDKVVLQTGNNTSFRSMHCEQEAFIEMERFEKLINDASAVICHGGSGTLIHVLQAGKVPLVMPRRQKYAEHIDDHQFELVQALAKDGRVIPIYEPDDLLPALEQARVRTKQTQAKPSSSLPELVAEAIKELTAKRG
jgi:UDP-N-acetylglucosamine transferase subunit ALG13